MRTEKDSLGEMTVPDEAYYGIHTVRSMSNFSLSNESMPLEIVYGMVKLKWACARTNVELGLLAKAKGDAIADACRRILSGEFNDQFPVDVFQAGSGTSSNMNVNEVIANIAAEKMGGRRGDRSTVHPNDDVNMGQSTNNVFPSGTRIAAVELSATLLVAVRKLVGALRKKAVEFADVMKSGRTHLRDAVPITLGQEFGGYVRALEKDVKRLEMARARLHELGIGGNAIGTGVNTKREFRPVIIRELSIVANETYEGAENGIEATQFLTDMVEMSSALRMLALDLQKMCNDLRLLSSGPNTGLNEIELPAVEPGSSIMPGKVNPSICEAANMVCFQVLGHDSTIAVAAGAGQLELNTHMPVVAVSLVKSLKLMERACRMLADKCVAGITANREACRRYFEMSAGLATVLNPKLGYDSVAELVKEGLATGKTLTQLVIEKKIMGEAELEALLRSSTGPNL